MTNWLEKKISIQDFFNLFDRVRYGIVIADSNDNVLYMNKYYVEVHGYSSFEDYGLTCPGHMCDKTRNIEMLNEVRKNGFMNPQETWHIHKNGSHFPLEINGVLIKGATTGEDLIILTAINLFDIQTYSRLSSKYVNLILLLRGLSHELKNPVAAFRGVTDLLLDKGCSMGPQKCRELFSRVSLSLDVAESSLHALRMIQNGDILTHSSKIYLPEFLSKLTEIVTLFMDVKKINHIFFNREDFENVYIYLNQDDLYHIMSNLIINAAQACSGKENSAISIFRKANGDKDVIFGVADNGCGISKDNIDKIFNVGFTTKKGGLGIGLMLVKSLCKKNDIDVWVKSKEGIGTKFYLKIRKV